MAIFLNQTSTALKTAAFFSTKKTKLKAFKPTFLGIPQDFCTCLIQCVPDLVQFTDEIGDDFYKNDFTSLFTKTLNNPPFAIGSATTGKIKNIVTGAETTLADGTHGDLVDGVGFWWFKVDWFKIFSTLGYGRYQLTWETVAVTSLAVIGEYCSPTYQLHKYSDKLANGTVRLEFNQIGRLNHSFDFRSLINEVGKGVIYEGQVRLPGSFVWESGNEETDHLTLGGTLRPSYQVKDQVRPKYRLDLHLVSAPQFVSVYLDDMFASNLMITDYNVYNFVMDPRDYQASQHRSIPVVKESSDFNAKSTQIRRSFNFIMVYDNDNIFATTN